MNFRLADFAPTLIYSQLVPLVQGIASWKQPLGLLSIIACCFQAEILTAERRLQKDYMSYFIAPPFPASTQPWMLLGEHQPFRLHSFSSFLQPVSKYYMTILSDAKNTSEKNFQCPLYSLGIMQRLRQLALTFEQPKSISYPMIFYSQTIIVSRKGYLFLQQFLFSRYITTCKSKTIMLWIKAECM